MTTQSEPHTVRAGDDDTDLLDRHEQDPPVEVRIGEEIDRRGSALVAER